MLSIVTHEVETLVFTQRSVCVRANQRQLTCLVVSMNSDACVEDSVMRLMG